VAKSNTKRAPENLHYTELESWIEPNTIGDFSNHQDFCCGQPTQNVIFMKSYQSKTEEKYGIRVDGYGARCRQCKATRKINDGLFSVIWFSGNPIQRPFKSLD